ncbi:zinc finger BED domain-containing protein RICESLEEPER 2-like protein [Tanacetum coccineum]
MFPVLSRMAMDIISVQASSVASESAFSTSGRVLSIRRTRLTPASLEMCMCLKDHLDAKERKQDKCPLETPLDFEEGVFDDEVQQNEAIPLSDEEIALDASSEGTMSPGGPRERCPKVFAELCIAPLNPVAQKLPGRMGIRAFIAVGAIWRRLGLSGVLGERSRAPKEHSKGRMDVIGWDFVLYNRWSAMASSTSRLQ